MLRGSAGVASRRYDAAARKLDGDDARLEVGGDERERGAARPPANAGGTTPSTSGAAAAARNSRRSMSLSTAARASRGPGTSDAAVCGVEEVSPPKEADHAQAEADRIRTRPVRARGGQRRRRRRAVPGGLGGWDGTWTRRAAFATSPCPPRRRRPSPPCARATAACSATRRSTARSGFRSSRSTARPKASRSDGKTLVLADVGASQQETRFAVLSTRRSGSEGVTLRALGLRRPFAQRPDALRDPVPRHRSERALQRPLGQPRHRQAGRRRDHRQARAGRGDERLALGARAERERRLGVHALREAERDRVRPRARHRQAARVLRRPAVAIEHAALSLRCACRSPTAAARSSWRSRGGNRLAVVDTHDVQGDGASEAVARRQRDRLRSPSRSPRRPRDVAVGVEDPQLAVGAVAAREDLADPLELPLGAELAGVRLDLLQRPPDELRDGDPVPAPVARSITGASSP